MLTRSTLIGIVLVALVPLAAAKNKQVLPDYVFQAQTVAVVPMPDAGEPVTDPAANRTAELNVEKALLQWGRYRLIPDAVAEIPNSESCSSNSPNVSVTSDGVTDTMSVSPRDPTYGILWQSPLVYSDARAVGQDTATFYCPAQEAQTTPLVISWDNDQFVNSFTDLNDGMLFGYTNGDDMRPVAWTKKNANVGWLVLPDASGHVTDLKHNFFSNITRQAPRRGTDGHLLSLNAFEALAYYDRPENGGNGNGLIDQGDSVWSQLRVWQNVSGDGLYDARQKPNEVFTLDQLGVESIDIRNYAAGTLVDGHGNKQLWVGSLTSNGRALHIYDVQFKAN